MCILYGGISKEREVSINTGKSIYNSIKDQYNVSKYDFDGDYDKLYEKIKSSDLVFNALHGGDGEDGTIQNYLEENNIKFTGSNSLASKKAMDKNFTKLLCVNKFSIITSEKGMLTDPRLILSSRQHRRATPRKTMVKVYFFLLHIS